MAIARAEFERNLGDSGLFAADALRALLDGPASDPDLENGDDLAHHLVSLGHLTAFQAEAVKARRFAELRIGNYEVIEHLGAGGMGTVYKARHRRMKRDVALKVLRREGAAGSFAKRFEREIETIAQLTHPNVVMAFDADEAEAGPFLVMEFVDGRDLGAEVRLGGPLSVAEAVEATLQAARGLDYAHGRGFVHRDVKPANLLRDSRGQVKVADLGLARLEEPGAGSEAVTLAGNVVGTAEFMAPEQAEDSSAVDHRTDIYALGGTLFYLLTGRAPYEAGSLMALLLKHREAPIPSLLGARPDVPAGLEAIFRRMVAKRPADRYATMADVVAALEEIRATTAGLAERPGGAAEPGGPPSLAPTISVEAAASDSATIRRMADLVVVVAEPSRFQAGIACRYLAELGVGRVSRAGSGAEVLEAAGREGADVVVSAMHLPDMTGVELARALRADPRRAGVGFVLASSESDGGRAVEAGAGPGMVLLPKPFDAAALARALDLAAGLGGGEPPTAPG